MQDIPEHATRRGTTPYTSPFLVDACMAHGIDINTTACNYPSDKAEKISDTATMRTHLQQSTLIKKTHIVKLDLSGMDLSGMTLNHLNMFLNILHNTDFSRTVMQYVDAHSWDAKSAIFTGATLHCCNFTLAQFPQASFQGSRISGCLFLGADLTGADFTGAEISPDTLFLGSNYEKATGLHGGIRTVREWENYLQGTMPPETIKSYLRKQLVHAETAIMQRFDTVKSLGEAERYYINTHHLQEIMNALGHP